MAVTIRDDQDGTQYRRSHRIVPLLPLRDMVIFPHMVVPLLVGREKSIAALDHAMIGDRQIALCTQKEAQTNDLGDDDLYSTGTLAEILQLLRLPDGTVKVLIKGDRRIRIRHVFQGAEFLQVQLEDIPESPENGLEVAALLRQAHSAFADYAKLDNSLPPEVIDSVQGLDEPGQLADTIADSMELKVVDKQAILETESPCKRLERLLALMQAELEVQKAE
jgi:ATP-dependent Lon protease